MQRRKIRLDAKTEIPTGVNLDFSPLFYPDIQFLLNITKTNFSRFVGGLILNINEKIEAESRRLINYGPGKPEATDRCLNAESKFFRIRVFPVEDIGNPLVTSCKFKEISDIIPDDVVQCFIHQRNQCISVLTIVGGIERITEISQLFKSTF